MPACVIYLFAYVRKRPKTTDDLQDVFGGQSSLARKLAASKGYTDVKAFTVYLTNRDRHFANTQEFRSAVSYAKEHDAPLVVGDLYSLLSATHPEKISEAVSTLYGAGVKILDAATGGEVDKIKVGMLVTAAKVAGSLKRRAIRRGLAKAVRRMPADNQEGAAAGTSRAADLNAKRLAPTVEAIATESSKNNVLSPTILAQELNKRSIPTPRGKSWTAGSARNLLRRLSPDDVPE